MHTKARTLTLIIKELFGRRYMPWYIGAIVATVLIVQSGFDWKYNLFTHTYVDMRPYLLAVADISGFMVGIILSSFCATILLFSRNITYRHYAYVVLSIILVSLFLSTAIKAVAGRESPPHFHTRAESTRITNWVDNSHHFQFGFLREQVFGGYPSSHATIFFALFAYCYFSERTNKTLTNTKRTYWLIGIGVYALFVAVGVSFGYHWFSESLAGAILGMCIGHAFALHVSKENV